MTGFLKEKQEDENKTAAAVLQERKVKAAEAYVDLKQRGFPGIYGTPRGSSISLANIKRKEVGASQTSSLRDSGIDMDDFPTPIDPKRNRVMLGTNPSILTPSIGSQDYVADSNHGAYTLRSPQRLRRLSFSSLKRVKSHLQLPLSRRDAISPVPHDSAEHHGHNTDLSQNGLKRKQSKKDLQKQQKLSKKISDLETQLEKARRNLRLVEDAPPVPDFSAHALRKPFVPGALASLPSERLLLRGASEQLEMELADEAGRKRKMTRSEAIAERADNDNDDNDDDGNDDNDDDNDDLEASIIASKTIVNKTTAAMSKKEYSETSPKKQITKKPAITNRIRGGFGTV